VPGHRITDQQIRLFMSKRKDHLQVTAASKAGISERSARRIESGQRQLGPSKPRNYRTRTDPLELVWDPVVLPLLQLSDTITPVGVFDYLCEEYSDVFAVTLRRTLERRIQKWRQINGQDKEVIFRQVKEFGQLGIMDFTWADFIVTIRGTTLKHRFFNYRLPASGWSYVQVVYGGESFVAVATGLQNAFEQSNGVPQEVRTDSLSAAYKNHSNETLFTERFSELSIHYGFKPSKNNTGIAHENGAIESANNHLKNQIRQALAIRGSSDFDSIDEYETFIDDVVQRRNRRIMALLIDEQRQLQPLPKFESVNYEIYPVKVSSTSTFQLKRVTYSVPSRLVGATLRVHLFDKKLDIYCHGVHTATLTRVHASANNRGHQINYRHLIGALMKKPRAFRGGQWRDQLLPNEDYRQIWKNVDALLSADEASLYMVRLLNIASKSDREEAVGRFVLEGINLGQRPNIVDCEERFLKDEEWEFNPKVQQHSLASYQQILDEVNEYVS